MSVYRNSASQFPAAVAQLTLAYFKRYAQVEAKETD
jgi:hypothetical protein